MKWQGVTVRTALIRQSQKHLILLLFLRTYSMGNAIKCEFLAAALSEEVHLL